MDPKTIEEIFKRLDTIGSKLLEGGVKFGEVMTKGAYAEAVSAATVAVISAVAGVWSYKIAAKGFAEEFKDRDLNVPAGVLGSGATIIAVFMFGCTLHFAIKVAIAPEWYAIKTLIGK